ncbi:MAG: tRNA dihydrouridine synthase [Promethearchaeota archaeon]
MKNNLMLAPLQNVTTAPFRRFLRIYSEIGLVYVPMLYTKRLMKSPESVEVELAKIKEERPIGVQIIGGDKDALLRSIDFLSSYEFDVLDLNAGCPSRRAINGKEGGYLLKDLVLLKGLISTAVKFSSRPVSLKIRTGFEEPLEVKKISTIINNSGLDFLTIHARTVKARFDDSKIDLKFVEEIKKTIDIPVIGNGDIINGKSAERFLNLTNVDGLMIGRGSIGHPKVFKQVYNYLREGVEPSFNNNNKELMKNYLQVYEKVLDDYLTDLKLPYTHEDYKFTELKRNAIWFTKNIENSAKIRYELSKIKNLKDFLTRLCTYFEDDI